MPPPQLAISYLREDNILSLFNLTRDNASEIWELSEGETIEVPHYLDVMLHRFYSVITPGPRTAESLFSPILMNAIATEMGYPPSSTEHPSSESKAEESTTQKKNPLDIRAMTKIQYPITFRYEKRMLTAISGYSLWYTGVEALGPSLIVGFEGQVESVESHCLVYMEAVHDIRKKVNQNAVVYGVITDGYRFTFLRIDQDSKISKSPGLYWNWGSKVAIVSHTKKTVRDLFANVPVLPLND